MNFLNIFDFCIFDNGFSEIGTLKAPRLHMCIFNHFIVNEDLQQIFNTINPIIQKIVSENNGSKMSFNHTYVLWNLKMIVNSIERNLTIRIFENTGSIGYIIEVYSTDFEITPNLTSYIFQLLKWVFSNDETKGYEPLLKDFLFFPNNIEKRKFKIIPFPEMPDVGIRDKPFSFEDTLE